MMKLKSILLLIISISIGSLISVSCHVDTPTAIDIEDPSGYISMVYTDSDTLVYLDHDSNTYQTDDTTEYIDFSVGLISDYYFKIIANDNNKIYKVSIFAEDTVDNQTYEIKTETYPNSNEIDLAINYMDYTDIPNSSREGFKIYAVINDESENSYISTKLGFSVQRVNFLELFHNDLGIQTEIDGADIDFRDKIGKMNIVQFHGFL